MNRHPETDETIIQSLARAAEDPESQWLDADTRNFVRFAGECDVVVTAESPTAATGRPPGSGSGGKPSDLVRVELWPAVFAVTRDMVASPRAH